METDKQAEIRGKNVFHVERSSTEGAGTEYICLNGCMNIPLVKDNKLYKPMNEIPIHNKTVRAVAARFEGINQDAINILGIASTYMILKGRIADNRERIVDWSGARPNWKKRMNRGIDEGLKEGIFNRIEGPFPNWIEISQKGERILEFYNSRFEEIREELEAKRIEHAIKRETARIKKEIRKKKNLADNQ